MGTKMRGVYQEAPEATRAREAFEASHSFKVGDEVYVLAEATGMYFKYHTAKVVRTVTTPETGPCIRVERGGVGINIFFPNIGLIPITRIARFLYA